MSRLVALLLTLGALALAPQWASAHGGHDQALSNATDEAAPSVALVAGSVPPSLSESCPGAPGRRCCCGTAFALAGAGKPAPANTNAWTSAPAMAAGATQFADSSVPPIAAPWWSQARPRAPPLSS